MYQSDFPALTQNPHLIYLDSAATTLKPQAVIDSISHFLRHTNAPIGRALYPLAIQATEAISEARQVVAQFLQVNSTEVIFTANASSALNLLTESLTESWSEESGEPSAEVIISASEHHSTLLPWWRQANLNQITLRQLSLTASGETDWHTLNSLLSTKTKAVICSLISNVTGELAPLPQIRQVLDQAGSKAILIVDASQAIAHMPVHPLQLGADFLYFSGHKLYAPNGVGVLWGQQPLLEALPVVHPGGGAVQTAKDPQHITYQPLPHRLESGSPASESIVGLQSAIQYLETKGLGSIYHHLQTLQQQLLQALQTVPDLQVIGQPVPASGLVSFHLPSIHPHDLAEILGEQSICIRAGQHCTGPLHQALNLSATARVSLGVYNTEADIQALILAIQAARHALTLSN